MPTLLVFYGEVIPQHMQEEGIDQEALQAALREHGMAEISGVEMGYSKLTG